MSEKKISLGSPVVVYGTVATVLVVFGPALLRAVAEIFGKIKDALGKEPSFGEPETLPALPSSAGVIAGEILSPQNGGLVVAAGITSETYSVKVSITNPESTSRRVLVALVTKEYPHLGSNTGSTLTKVIDLSPGRNVIPLTVGFASSWRQPGTKTPAHAQLFVEGKPASAAVYYEIE